MIQRLLVLLPLLLLMVPLTLRAAPEERPPIAFQVYLWPGTPNPNLEAKKKERKAGDDFENMVSYVAPTLQFSPDGKAQVQDIQAAERRLSPVYRYRGANPLVFFRAESIGDGEARRVPLGSVNLAPSMGRALLLFLPNPRDPDTFLIYPIDNSRTRVLPGQASVHNITGSTVACLFNKQQLLLKPGQQEIVPLGAQDNVNVVVRLGAEDKDGEWKERYTQQLFVNPNDSLTVLIYNKPGKANAYRIMKIDNPVDTPPENEETPETQP